jgi:apolipoprotein N-acyltransferase
VALEMIRGRLFSGFPWNPLGASQYQLVPLIQIASVTGVYGVSFLVVWVSLSLFSAGRMIFRRPALRMAWQGKSPAAGRGRGAVRFGFAESTDKILPARRCESRSFNPAFRKL